VALEAAVEEVEEVEAVADLEVAVEDVEEEEAEEEVVEEEEVEVLQLQLFHIDIQVYSSPEES